MGGKRKRAAINRERKAARRKEEQIAQAAIGRMFPPGNPEEPRIIFAPTTVDRADLASATEEESMPPETSLYKYLPQRYAHSLLRGNTRIGTLYDFRKIEHGKGIADPEEGTKLLRHGIDSSSYVGGTPEAEAMSHMGLNISPGARLRIDGLTFERAVNHPDAFVWCCSSRCDTSVMSQLDGAEACIKIRDAGAFFAAMTECINAQRKVKFLGFREVTYLPRTQKWNQIDLGGSAAFLKEPGSYGSQYEVRAVWLPLDNDPIEPMFIDLEALSEHCEEVRLVDVGTR